MGMPLVLAVLSPNELVPAELSQYPLLRRQTLTTDGPFHDQSATSRKQRVGSFHHVFADALVRRGAARSGLTWHFARPPVIDLEYEMDCRRVLREMVI